MERILTPFRRRSLSVRTPRCGLGIPSPAPSTRPSWVCSIRRTLFLSIELVFAQSTSFLFLVVTRDIITVAVSTVGLVWMITIRLGLADGRLCAEPVERSRKKRDGHDLAWLG